MKPFAANSAVAMGSTRGLRPRYCMTVEKQHSIAASRPIDPQSRNRFATTGSESPSWSRRFAFQYSLNPSPAFQTYQTNETRRIRINHSSATSAESAFAGAAVQTRWLPMAITSTSPIMPTVR